MPVKVRIPTPLRKLTNNEEVIEVSASTVGGAFVEMQSRYPGIQERLWMKPARSGALSTCM